MPDYLYTMKQIQQITGKSYTALYSFAKENADFINQHTKVNGKFKNYDEEALQYFIKRFGRVDKPQEEGTSASAATAAAEDKPAESVIAAFEAQIEALKAERDALSFKLEQREKDCAEWRTQAGQALNALSKEQERAERLEERLAGYLPAPAAEADPTAKRKLTFRERVSVLFGRELKTK